MTVRQQMVTAGKSKSVRMVMCSCLQTSKSECGKMVVHSDTYPELLTSAGISQVTNDTFEFGVCHSLIGTNAWRLPNWV